MSQRRGVSGKTLRGLPMGMRGRGGGGSTRIPVHIQPVSTRVIPAKRPYEESSSESGSDEEAEWEDPAVVSSAQTQGMPLPTIGEVNVPETPVARAVRPRGRTNSKGGISITEARASNHRTYWVSYRGTRRHYYSLLEAKAALRLFRTGTMCPGCERPIPHVCSECGHREVDEVIEVAGPAAAPVPVPVAAEIPAGTNIRVQTLSPGVLTITVNGVTFTTTGDFNYP
jgi:hypothetical protein